MQIYYTNVNTYCKLGNNIYDTLFIAVILLIDIFFENHTKCYYCEII